jgi:hypothetical protein
VKLVQEMLRHADITTTMKYAHVTHNDLLSAMEKAARARPVTEIPDETPDEANVKKGNK